jgi:hypothetical protein
LEILIRARINKKKGSLSVADWNKIAKKYNSKFTGVEVKVGEKLPGHKDAKGVMSKDRVLKKAHTLPPRSSTSIKAQVKKWPDIMKMIEKEVVKYSNTPGSDSSIELEAEDEAGTDEDSDTSSIDADLQGGNSDDEKDGQRPASTQNGARLVEASG